MSTATVVWLVLSILFSIAVIETFLATIHAFRPRAVKVAIYQVAVVVWLFGPISSLEAAASWFAAFGEIDKVAWLGLWFSASVTYLFFRRQRVTESLQRVVW